MARIFISYRRADSRTFTNRIYDRLRGAFRKRNVFKDIDNLPIGRDFRDVLREATSDCEVMLVIIGPDWLTITDEAGNRRLDDPKDFVRLEVEAGLQRHDILVVPLLVDGASMPSADELPETLQELAYKHGFVIHDDPLFHANMDTLIRQLREQNKRGKFRVDWGWWLFPALIFIVTFITTFSRLMGAGSLPSTPEPSQTAVVQLATNTLAPSATEPLDMTDTPTLTDTHTTIESHTLSPTSEPTASFTPEPSPSFTPPLNPT